MTSFQQTVCDTLVAELMRTGHCTRIVLYGELARDEGDDFSAIECVVIGDEILAHDLVHAREQWCARFGQVLSIRYPADELTNWERTIECLYDDGEDAYMIRLSVYTHDEREESQMILSAQPTRVLFQDPLMHWPEAPNGEWSQHERGVYIERSIRALWHGIYDISVALERSRPVDVFALYSAWLDRFAMLCRAHAEYYPVERGLRDISIDGDDALARMFESLTVQIEARRMPVMLRACADALEQVSRHCERDLDCVLPSPTVVRAIREYCGV